MMRCKTLCNSFTKAIIDKLNGDSDYLFDGSPNK